MISEPEARQILGITEHSTWEEILQVCLQSLVMYVLGGK
jgi:hypothetical protein